MIQVSEPPLPEAETSGALVDPFRWSEKVDWDTKSVVFRHRTGIRSRPTNTRLFAKMVPSNVTFPYVWYVSHCKTRIVESKEKSFECSKVCGTSRSEEFFLRIDVGTATQTAVRRNYSFESTGSVNIRFEGLSFAVKTAAPQLRGEMKVSANN